MAEAIEEAYSDLFNLRRDAQNMDVAEVRGKFRSLTQGQKSENVINLMAATFAALCEQADWSKPQRPEAAEPPTATPPEKEPANKEEPPSMKVPTEGLLRSDKLQLHYNIQLILPNSRDPAVFDALFTALKRHLL